MSGNSSESIRKKNQFDKEERVHLLAIMRQYSPILEKSASTLVRKRIWMIIEEEFKRAGFTRKSSAQLKKYWQNYKYHSKRAKRSGKENKKRTVSEVIESLEWDRHQVYVDSGPAVTKCPEDSEFLRSVSDSLRKSPSKLDRRPSETRQDNGSSVGRLNASSASIGCSFDLKDLSRVKEERNDEGTSRNDFETEETSPLKNLSFEEEMLDVKKEIIPKEDQLVSASNNVEAKQKTENRIVVSNARISNNSVTVSVIYPDDNNERVSNNTFEENFETRSAKEPAEPSWNECREETNGPNSIQNANPVHWAPPFECPNLFERDNDRRNLDETNGNANNEKIDTFGSNGSDDSSQTRQVDDNLGGRKKNDNARGKCFVTHNRAVRSGGRVFLTDYRNRLKHRLLLQQLEIEEKRLKVKIAEMSFQEVQLRIQALYEDMRRTEELHQLRLLQATSSSSRIERD